MCTRAAFIFVLIGCAIIEAAELEPLKAPQSGKAGFTLLPAGQSGVYFTNTLADASAEKNRIMENGSGVALGDIDGDGLCDIYLCALERPNALFRNLGNWRFEEVPDAGGAACIGQASTGAAFADVDRDGDLDLLVNGIASGTRLFRNDGKGHFVEDTASGLERKSGSTSLALADIDGDGDLDLFVVSYRSNTIRDGAVPGFEVSQVGGQLVVKPEEQFEVRQSATGPQVIEKGEPDVLYLNDGRGKFSAASWTDGRFLDEEGHSLKAAPRDWGLAAMFRDLNGDGAPDLYICNDFIDSPDEIWINDGKGKFRALPRLAIRHTSWSSMSVDVADINRDGFMDIFVADMLSPNNVRRQTQKANSELSAIRIHTGEIDNRPQNFQNTLQLNRGDGTFAEIAQLAGLAATDWTWSAIFLDVDLDGWEDLLVTTGNLHDIQDADTSNRIAPQLNVPPYARKPVLLEYPRLETQSRVFRNNHDLTFTEKSHEWGFDRVGISHGMGLGDLDGDGDLDVVVNNMNAGVSLYRNDSSAPRIAVRLPNGVGARIEVRSAGMIQSQEVIAGGRYLSCDDGTRTFAAVGRSDLTIHWRNGAVSMLTNVAANQLVQLQPPGKPAETKSNKPAQIATWFEDATTRLNHTHSEAPFDDWGLQPLAPNRFSQMGPQICAVDLDADGFADLVVAGPRGQTPAFYRNDQRGSFSQLPIKASILDGDQDGIVAIGNMVAVAVSNFESRSSAEPSVVFYSLINGAIVQIDALSGQAAVAGPLAFDETAHELFVGSRFVAGKYPQAVASRIFQLQSGRWKLDRKLSENITSLATAAQLIDVDGDHDMDLVLACDWDSPHLFRNNGKRLVDVTKTVGLAPFTGRWTTIAAADFNGDGKADFIVGNFGRNTRSQRFLSKPLKLFYGDFNADGRFEMLESFFDPELGKYVPWRGRVTLARAIPSLNERFPTFATFGSAGSEELLRGLSYETVEASTLDTMLFINRGGHFEPAPLPDEVQFAPVMGISVADFDGDGRLDVFLAQNFFALHDETTRMDAGRGLLLQGDGRGGFRAVPGQESGLLIYGEQRGCAAADFNHDGKVDLVVTQNSGPTRVYLNRRGAR